MAPLQSKWMNIVAVLLSFVCVIEGKQDDSQLFARGDCRTISVASGDTCGTLAKKCGISPPNFTKFNPKSELCSTLSPGQRVCCSAGSLPDITPKTHPNGTCASYNINANDTCSSIAASHGLLVGDINRFNNKTTWGWSGCDNLIENLAICLSTGHPPLPSPVGGSICGPTKPGTHPPASNETLSGLNSCPLNACCNIWGQCGITPDYCTAHTGLTGNPGTAPTGENGCISNCGTNIINKRTAPDSFVNIGYYESWNMDRPCLTMKASAIFDTQYTHVHWAFATITDAWNVNINDTHRQFPDFLALYGTKRIVSFGGWGYSTTPTTYDQLRKAMSPSNAHIFAENVVAFVDKNNLDGVDFDWEYPGAPDIPGIPAGLPSDGPNYLSFLQLLREKMPKDKTISIAAPASYWYLKAFPIAEMAKSLDYIVYMTYDLHGQWDYGNKWSQEGCPDGNCLRSHVNSTETEYALAMITKAGVDTNKITVGVSSYGRSFQMTTPGCTGPMCHYTGPKSGAQEGNCTRTAGYISNAEIDHIIKSNTSHALRWYDKNSDSNFMVHHGNQWVAYMNRTVKDLRKLKYKKLNFAGTIDWAIDLQSYAEDVDEDDGMFPIDDEYDAAEEYLPPTTPLPPCNKSYQTLDELDAALSEMPDNCKVLYTVDTLNTMLSQSLHKYTQMMKNGYDGKFKTYAESVSSSAGQTVEDFVYQNGDKYFTCIVSETEMCCDDCAGGAQQCRYCFQGDCTATCGWNGCNNKRDTGAPPQNAKNIKTVNYTEPCPPNYSKRGYGPNNPYEQTVYWSMIPSKKKQFYADLLNNTGIPENKIKIGNYNRGNNCEPHAEPDDSCWSSMMDFDIPVPNNFGPQDVTNPKDLFNKALANSTNLSQQLSSVLLDLRANAWGGDGNELIDAISLPIFMIVEATENMAMVDTIAEKIDEEKKKAIILAVIGAILFFIPVVGEVAGSVAGAGDIASIITILGTAGNAAMDIYTIVADPQNALLGILGLIMAPLALGEAVTLGRAANIRRGMSDEDIAKLGSDMASRMSSIQKITGVCRRI